MMSPFRVFRQTVARIERALDAMDSTAKINETLRAENGRLAELAMAQAAQVDQLKREVAYQMRHVELLFAGYGRQQRDYCQVATERNRLRRLAHTMVEHATRMGVVMPLDQDDARLLACHSVTLVITKKEA